MALLPFYCECARHINRRTLFANSVIIVYKCVVMVMWYEYAAVLNIKTYVIMFELLGANSNMNSKLQSWMVPWSLNSLDVLIDIYPWMSLLSDFIDSHFNFHKNDSPPCETMWRFKWVRYLNIHTKNINFAQWFGWLVACHLKIMKNVWRKTHILDENGRKMAWNLLEPSIYYSKLLKIRVRHDNLSYWALKLVFHAEFKC